MTQTQRAVSLADLAEAGYVTDEWKRWQQGDCYTYAHALLQLRPDLHLGSLDQGMHLFAHDNTHAYDSAGKHCLPYAGVTSSAVPELRVGLDWYDGPDPDLIPTPSRTSSGTTSSTSDPDPVRCQRPLRQHRRPA